MAAVYHLNPSFHGKLRQGHHVAEERLPALLRGRPRAPTGAMASGARSVAADAPSWPLLESWVRRILWLAALLVVAADLLATFVLRIR